MPEMKTETGTETAGWRTRARRAHARTMRWVVRNVPPGVRTLLGLLLILGGVFGFLPVLGFWMIPLGVAVILLDVAVVRRWARRQRSGKDAE